MKTKERSIRFTAEEVQATLARRKTQVRQVARVFFDETAGGWATKVEPHGSGWVATFPYRNPHTKQYAQRFAVTCPYAIGDRLWVQETWRPVGPWETRKETVQYRADKAYLRKTGWPESFRVRTNDSCEKWRPSIHMARWASRILLEVMGIRVQRVQEISDADVLAEGVQRQHVEKNRGFFHANDVHGLAFAEVWDSLNAKRGYGWAKNPWVWVREYKVISGMNAEFVK